ncbi:MAG: CRISPR-associated endonuclease Cas2 [Campylobacterota bacterium]|nr:CRISPR-associated endonuclease Cas2 [Campylobacterota bacterium]
MQHIVVVYDISNDKTRRIVGEILEGFGRRVNRSVFECKVKNKKTRDMLESALKNELHKHDSLRIYTLCANCRESSVVLGDEPDIFSQKGVIMF